MTIHAVTIGAGTPSLFLHCSLASHRSLLSLAQLLPGQRRLMDLPGHGGSADWDGVSDYHTLCTDAASAQCDGPTHLIGHSFGATVALRLACDRPELVSRLTLIEPVFPAIVRGRPAWDTYRRESAPYVLAWDRGDHVTATRAFHAMWGEDAWDLLPTNVQMGLIRRMPLIPAGAPAIEDDTAGLMRLGGLSGIRCPVTMIRGENSRPVIAAIHAALGALLPQARDHTVPGAGHMVALTHAPDVARIIRAAG